MSTRTKNFFGLTVVAIQSARELADTLHGNQQIILQKEIQAWIIALEDLLQAITKDYLGLLDLRLLVIYCCAACECLQACTGPTDLYTVALENELASYTFIVHTALALAKGLPIDKDNVLQTKDSLDGHLRQMESRIWNNSENQQKTMQRDELKGEVAYFEQVSKLLSPSIEEHDPQNLKNTAKAAAYGALESYVVHLREECRTIDHELSKQNLLAKEKNCVIDCLDVCRKALDGSNGLECKDLVPVEDTVQVVASSTSNPHQPGDLMLSETLLNQSLNHTMVNGRRQVIREHENDLRELCTKRATATPGGFNDSLNADGNRSDTLCFENVHTGFGKIGIHVTNQDGDNIIGEFSSVAELEGAIAERNIKKLATEELQDVVGRRRDDISSIDVIVNIHNAAVVAPEDFGALNEVQAQRESDYTEPASHAAGGTDWSSSNFPASPGPADFYRAEHEISIESLGERSVITEGYSCGSSAVQFATVGGKPAHINNAAIDGNTTQVAGTLSEDLLQQVSSNLLHPPRNPARERQEASMLLTNAENGLVRILCSDTPIYIGIISLLDARSVIRLSWTCTSLASIPTREWRAEKVYEWFVEKSAMLRAVMRTFRSVAGGNCLPEFFRRSPRSGALELFILVDTLEGFEAMTQVFLDESYELKEAKHDPYGKPFSQARVLNSLTGRRQRIVTIFQCYGSNEIHAVLLAPSTNEALVLTSDMVVCMYPLLALVHDTYHNFSDSLAAPLNVEIPLDSAIEKELLPERWLGDRRCFTIQTQGGAKMKSEWSLKTCKGKITQYNGRYGLLSSSWERLPSLIATFEKSLLTDRGRITH